MNGWSVSRLTRGNTPWLISIMLLALIPRIYWITAHTSVIENEGAIYASLGQNLLSGNGYVSLLSSDVFLNFPPLYPFLIAAVSYFVGDVEWAGRLISVISGTLVIVPVYLAVLILYGTAVARIAAFLFALHPLLIGYSGSLYVESTYLFFVMLGFYFALRAQSLESYVPSAVAGIALGLAYLARSEALLFPMAAATILFLVNWRTPRRAGIACGLLLASFLIVASPYIVFLWAQTGSIRLEAKGPVFFLLLQRMASGMSYLEAAYGFDGDPVKAGPFLRSWLTMLQTTTHSVSDMFGYLGTMGRSRLIDVLTALMTRSTGSLLLFLLATLGLLRSPWNRERLVHEALLFALLVAVIGGLLMTQWTPTRYLLLPLAFILIWAAKGIQELSGWVHETFRYILGGARSAMISMRSTQALLIAMILLVSLTGARWESELRQGWGLAADQTNKEAGLWLRNTAPGPKIIMDVSSVFSFYAGGTHLFLPYCDEEMAIRYVASRNADYIVLSSARSKLRPYLHTWLEAGIPDSRSTLVYSQAWPDGGKIAVYQWRP